MCGYEAINPSITDDGPKTLKMVYVFLVQTGGYENYTRNKWFDIEIFGLHKIDFLKI